MQEKVIRDGNAAKAFIRSVIQEKLDSAMSPAPVPLMNEEDLDAALAADTGTAPAETPPAAPSSTTAPTEVSVKTIVDKLNSIRAGKSFRDSAIEQKLNTYFDSLEDPEKKALVQFLSGLAQVVTGDVPDDAIKQTGDPSNPPASVKMSSSSAESGGETGEAPTPAPATEEQPPAEPAPETSEKKPAETPAPEKQPAPPPAPPKPKKASLSLKPNIKVNSPANKQQPPTEDRSAPLPVVPKRR